MNLKRTHRAILYLAAAFFLLYLGSLLDLSQSHFEIHLKSSSQDPGPGDSAFEGIPSLDELSNEEDDFEFDREEALHRMQRSRPFWFIGTVIAAQNIQRRTIIRATWQNLYRNDSLFTLKFIVANPTKAWEPLIAHEQELYGDIVVLKDIEESGHVANTVKTIYYYKWLAQQGMQYPWITKIDDDSWLDVPHFLDNYLYKMTDLTVHPPVATVTRTVIARRLWTRELLVPGGQFYTMTWDLMLRVIDLWDLNPHDNINEDQLVGRLLYDARSPFDLIDLPNPVSFDYDDGYARGDGTAWSDEEHPEQLKEWVHAVGPGAINPHKMKKDESYLRVSLLYDKEGLLPQPNKTKTSHHMLSDGGF